MDNNLIHLIGRKNGCERDFIGEDGILYCGTCKTPKQAKIKRENGNTVLVSCMCKCEEENLHKEQRERIARARMEKLERYRSGGFADAELKKCRFEYDDKKNPEITRIAQNYNREFKKFKDAGKGLFIYGGVGTGKTFVAACIANALIDRLIPALVTNFPRIINDITGLYEGKQKYIDSLNRYDLLVIDDFAVERQTDFTNEIVYNVIDSRYRSGKPLILTSNISIRDIQQERTQSRIKEMCIPLLLNGTDRRNNTHDSDLMSVLFG